MAFLQYRNPTDPRRLAAQIDPTVRILRADAYANLVDADALIVQARAQADAIVAGAQAAFVAEQERGYADGRESALMDQAEKMIETVGRTVDYFTNVENEMIDLVMMAVRKVVDGFDDREKTLIVVRNALAVVRNQKQMTLRLHPDEVETVRARVNDLLAAYPGVGYLDIIADGRLSTGSCILESEIGLVEANLEAQIAAVRNAFERMLGSRI